MATFEATVTMQDAYARSTTKRYQVEAVDIAAAITAFTDYLGDLATLSELDVVKYKVSTEATFADTVTAGANVDEGATFSFQKTDGDKVAVKVPGPVASVRQPDGSINIAAVAVTDWAAHFLSGSILVSDGEVATALLSGKLDK